MHGVRLHRQRPGRSEAILGPQTAGADDAERTEACGCKRCHGCQEDQEDAHQEASLPVAVVGAGELAPQGQREGRGAQGKDRTFVDAKLIHRDGRHGILGRRPQTGK